jgi:hypothetical protein
MALPTATAYILGQLRKHRACPDATWDAVEAEAAEKGFGNLSKSAREQVRLAKVAWQAEQAILKRTRQR